MPHLALGILVMLVGAAVMACGLYAHAISVPVQGRALARGAATAVLVLLGLGIAIVGIIISFEPVATAPR